MPKFVHDCDKCISLDHYDGHDLYYCEQGGRPTLIARYGDDGPEYKSGIRFTGLDPHITEAFDRAKERGLV